MRKFDRITIKNMQRTFIRSSSVPSCGLAYRARSKLPVARPLGFISLQSLPSCCPFCPNVIHDAVSIQYQHFNRRFLLKILLTQLSSEAQFLKVANCKMWSKLPGSPQSYSRLARFKAQLNTLQYVPLTINLTQANIGLDEAQEEL